MKNKETLRAAMDRRLSFLDERPSCRAAVQYRIAQEEEPVMKKKVSFVLVFAVVMVLLATVGLATGVLQNLLSPRVSAAVAADRALEEKYGVTAEMQTFFIREETELADGSVRVAYTGSGSLACPLGTYTAVVKDGKAEISWSHDGEDVSGGYGAEAWGLPQLRQMMVDSADEAARQAYLDRAGAIAAAHNIEENDSLLTVPGEEIDAYIARLDADKTAAMNASRLSEDEMVAIGREFIISHYGLDAEQASRMRLLTNFDPEDALPETEDSGNGWYEMFGGKPCFLVEYMLDQPEVPEQEGAAVTPLPRGEKDGWYVVYVNVETGEIEEYEYNSGLGGKG